MSKSFRNIGILLASTCGVLTAYSALRPALEEQKGLSANFSRNHTVISDQMRDDFKEAEKEWRNEGGFGWGIRQVLFGRNPYAVVREEGEKETAGRERREGSEGGSG